MEFPGSKRESQALLMKEAATELVARGSRLRNTDLSRLGRRPPLCSLESHAASEMDSDGHGAKASEALPHLPCAHPHMRIPFLGDDAQIALALAAQAWACHTSTRGTRDPSHARPRPRGAGAAAQAQRATSSHHEPAAAANQRRPHRASRPFSPTPSAATHLRLGPPRCLRLLFE